MASLFIIVCRTSFSKDSGLSSKRIFENRTKVEIPIGVQNRVSVLGVVKMPGPQPHIIRGQDHRPVGIADLVRGCFPEVLKADTNFKAVITENCKRLRYKSNVGTQRTPVGVFGVNHSYNGSTSSKDGGKGCTMDPSRKSGGALHRLHCFCLEFDGACEVQRRVPTDWIIEPVDVSGYASFSLAS